MSTLKLMLNNLLMKLSIGSKSKRVRSLDYKKLNRLWREIILKIPIVNNFNELVLIKFLLQYQERIELINVYPYVYAYEFPINPEMSNLGSIDLILLAPNKDKNKFLIVEVKYLQTKSGKTSRESRRRKRRKVEEQSRLNMRKFQALYPNANVDTKHFTNDDFTSWRSELTTEYEEFVREEWRKIKELYPCIQKELYGDETS